MTKRKINGIMPPLTTPFDERGELDLASLAFNVERYNDTGLAGYVALGSNGEAVHLNDAERVKVIQTIQRSATPDHVIVGGINELSTRAALESIKRAADCGVDAVLVVTPYFYKASMTQETLYRYYVEVADNSSVPVLVYNVPQNTGVVIDSATIARLASHQNIVGVKDSAGNFGAFAETLRLVPENFSVMCGSGSILLPSLLMGGAGAVLAIACAAPEACVQLYLAARSGEMEKAVDLQRRLAPVSHAVTTRFGVSGLKAAMNLLGFKGGSVRSPLVPLPSDDREQLLRVMRDSRLFAGLE